MKKLVLLLLFGGALWHYRAQLPWNNSAAGAFNDDGSAKAVLMIADNCQPCEQIQSHLDKLYVVYETTVINFEAGGNVAELHRYTAGANMLPVLVIGTHIIRGYNSFELPFDVADALGSVDHLPRDQGDIISKAHFNTDGSKKIVLYGTTWCGYCKKAREQLDKDGFAYEDVDVERSGESMRHYKTLGGQGYPLIFVGAKAMSGFDANKLRDLATRK